MEYLGIDIGGTYIKYGMIDENNTIIRQWKKETLLFEEKDAFYDYICDGLDLKNVACAGISAPGVLAEDSTIISKAAPNVRVMYGTNVNQEFEDRLKITARAVNDAKSAGLCEMKIGNGKGSKSSVYFVIGTGIGGCVCDEKGVIEGQNRIAGEFSQLPIGFLEDEPNKLKGLCEIASMTALIEIYNRKVEEEQQLKYGKEITDLYLAGDETAVLAMDEWCKNIVLGLYIIITFYSPEVICIGGGISKEDWFIDKIRDMMEHVVEHDFKDITATRIERCRYDNDANLLGAVLFARQKTGR